jgi:4a-hydroxytetrahydrobiopterin dehydratase
METYNEQQIAEKLKSLNGWSFKDKAIEKEFKFKSFNQALGFIVRIGLFAEQADHHPELFNVYNQVKIRLNTHSANGITDLDFDLAKKIESIL